MASSSTLAAAAARYGKLWGRGHETFSPSARRILSVQGAGATKYLQGLVTCDLTSEPPPPRLSISTSRIANSGSDAKPPVDIRFTSKMRSACFLDQKGRIITDAFLWRRPFTDDRPQDESDSNIEYLIDTPGDMADLLLQHLNKFKLPRAKVEVKDKSHEMSVHCVYGTLNADGTPPGYLAVS